MSIMTTDIDPATTGKMAARRASARLTSVDTPKGSPQSARSARSAGSGRNKPNTPTKKSGARSNGKTSPYFAKKAQKGKAKKQPEFEESEDEDEEDEEVEEDKAELDSATGMTETSSSSSDEEPSEDDFDPSTGDEAEEEIESEVDSDFLDEGDTVTIKTVKRKSTGGGGAGSVSKKVKGSGPKGGSGPNGIDGYDDEDENVDFDEDDLEEGQEVALRIYPAPKTGQVPPGRISQNTLNFLKNMFIPERNDRDWFRSHEPAFRQAETEWKAFAGTVQFKIHEADDQIPILPPKDVIYRIYRDVRFSSDKTPYKKSFSMSTSRGGRKGNFAGYFLAVSPHGRSLIASGIWMPDKNDLQAIRDKFLSDPDEFRSIIGRPEFVQIFGPAKPHPKGERQNVFGHDDALKVAPKGIDKQHKDIDLLKLRTIAVVKNFTDEEVLAEDFQDRIKEIVQVMAPFVHLLNDYMAAPAEGE